MREEVLHQHDSALDRLGGHLGASALVGHVENPSEAQQVPIHLAGPAGNARELAVRRALWFDSRPEAPEGLLRLGRERAHQRLVQLEQGTGDARDTARPSIPHVGGHGRREAGEVTIADVGRGYRVEEAVEEPAVARRVVPECVA